MKIKRFVGVAVSAFSIYRQYTVLPRSHKVNMGDSHDVGQMVRKYLTETMQKQSYHHIPEIEGRPFSNYEKHPGGWWVEPGWKEREETELAAHLDLTESALRSMRDSSFKYTRKWSGTVPIGYGLSDAWGYMLHHHPNLRINDITGKYYHTWEVEFGHMDERKGPICKLILTQIPCCHCPKSWEMTEDGPLKVDELLISRHAVRYTIRPIN